MARWPGYHAVAAGFGAALGVVRRWRRLHMGEAMALDLSAMVTRPEELAETHSRSSAGWPRGVQEDDDVRWRWDQARMTPGAGEPGTRAGRVPRPKG